MTQKSKAIWTSLSFPISIGLYAIGRQVLYFLILNFRPTGLAETGPGVPDPYWLDVVLSVGGYTLFVLLIVGLYLSIRGIMLLHRIKKEAEIPSQNIN